MENETNEEKPALGCNQNRKTNRKMKWVQEDGEQ